MTSPWTHDHNISGQLETEPKCPGCGDDVGGFISVALDGARPKPGDVAICLYCATPLQFHGSPLALRRLEGDELILARADPDFKQAEAVMKRLIAERGSDES